MQETNAAVDPSALFKLSYGLFVLTANENGKDNGCIINTAIQAADTPRQISVCVNKRNYTHDMVSRTGMFNVNILTTDAPFTLFQRFGFQSGRSAMKFYGLEGLTRTENGLICLGDSINACLSARVVNTVDLGSHTLFVGELTQAMKISDVASVTYQYYFDHIKPKPAPAKKKGFVCTICGYVYEGETLPADFVCPICKHGADVFKPLD